MNNNYTPKINEFGDINVSIKSILDELDNYSDSKKLKIKRRSHKKNRKIKAIKVQNVNVNLPQNKFRNISKFNE